MDEYNSTKVSTTRKNIELWTLHRHIPTSEKASLNGYPSLFVISRTNHTTAS